MHSAEGYIRALTQPLTVFICQIISLPRLRIGFSDLLRGMIAQRGRRYAEQNGKRGKHGNMENYTLFQGQITPEAFHFTHLYPHPQTVSIYTLSVNAAIPFRILRMCSTTTPLSPSLSYPQTFS